jgi:hypothetical protein
MGMIRALACLVLVSGCSVALQKKPTSGAVATSECTTSRTLPYLDTAGVVAGLAAAGVGLSDQEHDTGTALMMAGTAVAFTYMVSAATGFRWSTECRRQQPQSIAAR